MTVVDVTLSFPGLLLALAFVAALGPSLLTIILVLGLTGWERYARVVRAEVLALREKDFVEAARAMGVGTTRILCRHLLPNTFSSIIVLSTLQVAQAILQESALSFLGVGSGSAYPTWGQMIALGRDFVTVAWWLPTFPGLAILAHRAVHQPGRRPAARRPRPPRELESIQMRPKVPWLPSQLQPGSGPSGVRLRAGSLHPLDACAGIRRPSKSYAPGSARSVR